MSKVLNEYSKALAESVIAVTVSPSLFSKAEIDKFVADLSKEILEQYEVAGKPYGDTEEGLLQYLTKMKIIVG